MKYDGFQPGAVRCVSNQVSSPTMAPVTRAIPAARSCRARERKPAEDSVGSP